MSLRPNRDSGLRNYRRPSIPLADYDISDSRTSAFSSFLLLFALLEGMCGFVLPICNAFSEPKKESKRFFYEQFLLAQYCLSIITLGYLQALIFYHGEHFNSENQYFSEYAVKSNKPLEKPMDWSSPVVNQAEIKLNKLTTKDKNNLDLGMNKESNGNGLYSLRSIGDEPSQQEQFTTVEFTLDDEIVQYPGVDKSESSQNVNSTFQSCLNSASVPIASDETLQDSIEISKRIDNLGLTRLRSAKLQLLKLIFGGKPDNGHNHSYYCSKNSEGVSLYLRLGAVGFGFGVMIFDGFKIAEPWESKMIGSTCHGQLWVPIHVIHLVNVFWQTYFLFKHHQVIFNVKKLVIRFLLCHLAIANFCQWLKTIVEELGSEPAETHKIEESGFNVVRHRSEVHLIHFNDSGRTSCRSTVKDLAPFLFPCAIEYSLIAGAIFFKMFQKVGHVQKESQRMQQMRVATAITNRFSECHRSHKGLFVGLLIFMATLITMCLFFILFGKQSKRDTAVTLYQCTEVILLIIGILVCLATLFRVRVLKFNPLSEEGAFDSNLLLIGLVGMIFYDLFLLIPVLEECSNGLTAAKLFAAKAILEIIQAMLQVYFILEASRRCAGSPIDVRKKPGRTLVILLLILNLAMWFVNTFEVKRADNHIIHIQYYSGMAWKIITHIALPLIVFFRFHSTVCLSDIWENAYRFHSD